MFGEPEVVVGANRDDARCAPGIRQLELFDGRSVRRHATDPVTRLLGEPQRAIGREGNRCGSATRDWQEEFGRFAVGEIASRHRHAPTIRPALTEVTTRARIGSRHRHWGMIF
jgi:hypothetical protein